MVEKGIGGWRGHGKLSISTNHLDLITTPALDLQFVSMFQRWMNFYAEIARFSYPYIGNKCLRFYRLLSLEISFVILAYLMLGGIVCNISLIYLEYCFSYLTCFSFFFFLFYNLFSNNSQTIVIREYWLFYLFVLIIIFFLLVN